MSLATRCPSCHTVFRVVQDQLRVSRGWVRCGRCAEVFDASVNLVDPGTGEPRQGPTEPHEWLPEGGPAADPGAAWTREAAEPAAGPAPGRPAGPGFEPTRLVERTLVLPSPAPPEPPAAPVPVPQAAPPAPRAPVALATRAAEPDIPLPLGDEPAAAATDTPAPRQAAGGPAPAGPAAADAAAPAAGGPSGPQAEAPGESTPTPSFVREADRAARWRRPGVRAALTAGVVLAAATLALQLLVALRDPIAARQPALRPVLEALCEPLGCRVEPWRSVEALVVDSSTVLRVEKSDLYELSVTLRNRRGHDVAAPAIDLRLTDLQGQLIARRVLQAGELGAPGSVVRGDGELLLQGTLRVAATPVAGYTIELFYP